jgi:hypothetical protein
MLHVRVLGVRQETIVQMDSALQFVAALPLLLPKRGREGRLHRRGGLVRMPPLRRWKVRNRREQLFVLRGRALLRRVVEGHGPHAMHGRQVHDVEGGDCCVKLPRVSRRQFLYHFRHHALCGELSWWWCGRGPARGGGLW